MIPLRKISGLRLFYKILYLFFPKRCALCHAPLQEESEGLCLSCAARLPYTGFAGRQGTRMERMLWGKIPLGRVSAYCYYIKDSPFASLVHQLKYYGRKDLGVIMGRHLSAELMQTDFFTDMDVIVPVPLHWKKEKARGYNQSYCLALGVSQITGIPIDSTSLQRKSYTQTQTHQSVDGRWQNVAGVFVLTAPEKFAGKHILLMDDVFTTGATITACADAFSSVPDIHISVLTLACTDY